MLRRLLLWLVVLPLLLVLALQLYFFLQIGCWAWPQWTSSRPSTRA